MNHEPGSFRYLARVLGEQQAARATTPRDHVEPPCGNCGGPNCGWCEAIPCGHPRQTLTRHGAFCNDCGETTE